MFSGFLGASGCWCAFGLSKLLSQSDYSVLVCVHGYTGVPFLFAHWAKRKKPTEPSRTFQRFIWRGNRWVFVAMLFASRRVKHVFTWLQTCEVKSPEYKENWRHWRSWNSFSLKLVLYNNSWYRPKFAFLFQCNEFGSFGGFIIQTKFTSLFSMEDEIDGFIIYLVQAKFGSFFFFLFQFLFSNEQVIFLRIFMILRVDYLNEKKLEIVVLYIIYSRVCFNKTSHFFLQRIFMIFGANYLNTEKTNHKYPPRDVHVIYALAERDNLNKEEMEIRNVPLLSSWLPQSSLS